MDAEAGREQKDLGCEGVAAVRGHEALAELADGREDLGEGVGGGCGWLRF